MGCPNKKSPTGKNENGQHDHTLDVIFCFPRPRFDDSYDTDSTDDEEQSASELEREEELTESDGDEEHQLDLANNSTESDDEEQFSAKWRKWRKSRRQQHDMLVFWKAQQVARQNQKCQSESY